MKKTIYWIETAPKAGMTGDIFQTHPTFDHEEAKSALTYEDAYTTAQEKARKDFYIAFCEYEGTETDAKKALDEIIENSPCGFDYDIE